MIFSVDTRSLALEDFHIICPIARLFLRLLMRKSLDLSKTIDWLCYPAINLLVDIFFPF